MAHKPQTWNRSYTKPPKAAAARRAASGFAGFAGIKAANSYYFLKNIKDLAKTYPLYPHRHLPAGPSTGRICCKGGLRTCQRPVSALTRWPH